MDNALIIDLVLAGVLLAFLWRGLRRGLIYSLMGLVSVVLAFIGAMLLTAQFAEPVAERVYPEVREWAVGYLEAQEGAEEAGGELATQFTDAVGDMLETLRRFGVSDEAVRGVTESMTQSAVSAADRAAYLLVETVVRAAVFLLSFLAVLLVLKLLTRALNELCALPILWHINLFGGAALSLIKGVLLIFLVIYLAPRLGVTWFNDHAEGTRLLAWFVNNTPYSILASLT